MLGVLVLATTPARADVETTDPNPMPARSIAAGIAGHGGRYLGRPEGGWGPFVELALGHRRFQYLAELQVMPIKTGDDGPERRGLAVRGGVAVRWLARSFVLVDRLALEMHLEAFAGAAQLRWEHAERVWRPDLGVGVGYQIRWVPKVAFRVSARAYFAPHDRSAAPTACLSTTPCDRGPSSSTGLLATFGAAW